MKVFALIFSIYILLLSVMICPDGVTQSTFYDTTEITADLDHNHSSEDKDDCTPFCACSCCGTFLTMSIVQQITKVSTDLTSSYQISYIFDYSFDYYEGVWHPPSII